jgi:hypothetical protein
MSKVIFRLLNFQTIKVGQPIKTFSTLTKDIKCKIIFVLSCLVLSILRRDSKTKICVKSIVRLVELHCVELDGINLINCKLFYF